MLDAIDKVGFFGVPVDNQKEIVNKGFCLDIFADPVPLEKYPNEYECPANKDIQSAGQDLKINYYINDIPFGYTFVTLMIKAILYINDVGEFDVTLEWGRSFPDEDPDIMNDRNSEVITSIKVPGNIDLYAASGRLIIDRIIFTYQEGMSYSRIPRIVIGGYHDKLLDDMSNIPVNMELIYPIEIPQTCMPELLISVVMS